MTREEKIISIANLCDVKYPQDKYDDIFDSRRYEVIPKEVMHKRTLDFLSSYSDEEIDVIYDEAWATVQDLFYNSLPEYLNLNEIGGKE